MDTVNLSSSMPSCPLCNLLIVSSSLPRGTQRRFEAEGVPVDRIELGNELFDTYQGGFPTGAEYRAAMEPYIQTMRSAFPSAALALVGQ